MSKQDKQGVRTPADLERKYQFGKTFAEIIGLASDLRESVDSVESELRDEIIENVTSITRSTEQIIMSALESYSLTTDLEGLERTVESELLQMAEQISLNFSSASERITNVDGDVQTVKEYLEKHFVFGVDGLTIKAGKGEDAMQLLLDNDVIRFIKNGHEFGWWDGINFHTGNIFVDVDEVAQFGNYGFVPYDDGESDGLDLVRVGG